MEKTDSAQLIARILIASVFIVFGFFQFTDIARYTSNPAILKFVATTGHILSPTIVAYLVAAIDLFAGLLVLVGYQTRIAATVLIIFVGLTLFFAHAFWTMDGPARVANQAHFYKNLTLIGGLLLIVAFGPGRYSLEGR
jgi:putative oxidoreductase